MNTSNTLEEEKKVSRLEESTTITSDELISCARSYVKTNGSKSIAAETLVNDTTDQMIIEDLVNEANFFELMKRDKSTSSLFDGLSLWQALDRVVETKQKDINRVLSGYVSGNKIVVSQIKHPIVTLEEILNTNYPPIMFISEDTVPVGLTLISAAPKVGKTMLAMDLAYGVGTGGKFLGRFNCVQSEVLYLYLEGTQRSVSARAKLLGFTSGKSIKFATAWSTGIKALEDIETYLHQNKETRLIIIDVFALLRETNIIRDQYTQEYQEYTKWRQLGEAYDVAIVILSHTRKRKSDSGDFLEEAYGCNATTGVPNSVIRLSRKRGTSQGELRASLRDARELSFTMKFTTKWEICNENEYDRFITPERKEILDLLKSEKRIMKVAEIGTRLQKTCPNTSKLLSGLASDGYVTKVATGSYAINDDVVSRNG